MNEMNFQYDNKLLCIPEKLVLTEHASAAQCSLECLYVRILCVLKTVQGHTSGPAWYNRQMGFCLQEGRLKVFKIMF